MRGGRGEPATWPRSHGLVSHGNVGPAQRFALVGSTVTIGRARGNDLVIHSEWVSRQHAKLNRDGEHYVIQDLSSLNGTLVEGMRITEPQRLRNGDLIGLAPEVALVYLTWSTFTES